VELELASGEAYYKASGEAYYKASGEARILAF